jgi:hypothetical protein
VERAVLRRLAANGDSRFGESYFVDPCARALKVPTEQVWEALWGLVADRFVYLDRARQPASENWSWRVTVRGRRVASGESEWEPQDVQGFLRRLRNHTNPMDRIVLKYVEEALRAFNARCFMASSVMLGTASEQAVNELAASVITHVGTAKTAKLASSLASPRASQYSRFVALRDHLTAIRGTLPDGTADPVTLDAVADLLRVTRNAAGHPSGAAIDEDTAYTHLQMGGRYLLKMTDLGAWLDARPAA